MKRKVVAIVACMLLSGCSLLFFSAAGWATDPKAVDAKTREMNSRLPQGLSDDREENEFALRGLIASDPAPDIRDVNNKPVWDMKRYEFLAGDTPAPVTVNPALWRHAQRNRIHGLFKVADGIYQVRGYDISNITFIEGKTGYIVVDPLISVESARAALDLVYRHLPKRPVTAVIYTHSHVDHWGGVKGVVSEEDIKARKVRILAPEGFTREAINENVMARNAMGRRATYMFGSILQKGPTGQVDAGIGKTASSGTVSFIMPNEEIKQHIQEVTIDGVPFIFQQVPGTEAPVEMNFYLPKQKALCIAEITTASLHNLLTPRGAQVRDGLAWSKAIAEAIDLFGSDAEVLFPTHHWPRWGKENIISYLKKQRDMYKYIHDQTLRLMNQGYTMTECAEMIQLPQSLAGQWYNREFYGTVNFNVKAVYQRYLGWFDGNPANLHPLPPEEASRKYVDFMGGSQTVLKQARESMKKGEYRWVAQVVNHVVFAEPENREARELQADALEQLGYQSESPVWRNFYLTGAKELRDGVDRNIPVQTGSIDIIGSLPLETFFDFMAIRLNGSKAAEKQMTVNWVFTDVNQTFAVTLENSVLNYKRGRAAADAVATVTITRAVLDRIAANQATFPGRILAGDIQIDGSKLKFLEMMSCLDDFDISDFWFNIVTP